MNIKDVTVTEGPYSLFYIAIGGFRIGWYAWTGDKKKYSTFLRMFDRTWIGEADTPEEAIELIKDMLLMWLEEIADG